MAEIPDVGDFIDIAELTGHMKVTAVTEHVVVMVSDKGSILIMPTAVVVSSEEVGDSSRAALDRDLAGHYREDAQALGIFHASEEQPNG